MKEIGREKFGILYDDLSNYLRQTKGRIEGTGIQFGSTHEILSKLWLEGKEWEAITLIIAYHYSRTDALLLKYSKTSTLIRKGASIREIQSLLGIKTTKMEKETIIIDREEFEKEFGKIWELVRGKTTIKDILKSLNVSNPILENLWKQGKKWQTVTAALVLLRLVYFEKVEIDTEFGKFEFKKGEDIYRIIEILQSQI